MSTLFMWPLYWEGCVICSLSRSILIRNNIYVQTISSDVNVSARFKPVTQVHIPVKIIMLSSTVQSYLEFPLMINMARRCQMKTRKHRFMFCIELKCLAVQGTVAHFFIDISMFENWFLQNGKISKFEIWQLRVQPVTTVSKHTQMMPVFPCRF